MAFSKLRGRFPHSWAKPDWATHNSTHPREQGQIGGNKRHWRYKATSVLASHSYNKPAALLLHLESIIWTISLGFQKEQNNSHLRAGLWPCGIGINYPTLQQVMSLHSTVKSLLRGKCGRHIAQNFLGQPKQSLLHSPALRERGDYLHYSSTWKCWWLPVVMSWNTLGWPGSSSRLVTVTVGSSGLISPLNLPVLFLFFPGMLTGRSSHTQISSKIKSGINYLSTYPSWWLYGFGSLHPCGRVLALSLQTHPLNQEKSSVYQMASFCFCLIHCPGQQGTLGTAPQMTRHNYSTVETTREEQQLPKWRSKYSPESH